MAKLRTLRASTPGSILVVSYNIAGNKRDYNHARTAHVLRSIDADVIALQEVRGETQADNLAKELGLKTIYGKAHQNLDFGNAILTKFTVGETHRVELPSGSVRGNRKNFVAVHMTSTNPDRPAADRSQEFVAISTHFGTYKEQDDQSGKSRGPAQVIKKFITEPARNKLPALLCGDLNAEPESVALAAVGEEWTDNKSGPTFGSAKGLQKWQTRPNSGPSTKRIDYILDRGQKVYKVAGTYSLTYEESQHASDHRPLVALWVPW